MPPRCTTLAVDVPQRHPPQPMCLLWRKLDPLDFAPRYETTIEHSPPTTTRPRILFIHFPDILGGIRHHTLCCPYTMTLRARTNMLRVFRADNLCPGQRHPYLDRYFAPLRLSPLAKVLIEGCAIVSQPILKHIALHTVPSPPPTHETLNRQCLLSFRPL